MLASNQLLKKLIYRSSKCGILENDILLGAFARDSLHKLPLASLLEYEKLLNEVNDIDIFKWITCRRLASAGERDRVMETIPKAWLHSNILSRLQQYVLEKNK